MNIKQNALTNVSVQAHSYFDLQEQTERQRKRLASAIREADRVDNTQQKIADETVTELQIDGETVVKRISRQRVAQILQEKTDE